MNIKSAIIVFLCTCILLMSLPLGVVAEGGSGSPPATETPADNAAGTGDGISDSGGGSFTQQAASPSDKPEDAPVPSPATVPDFAAEGAQTMAAKDAVLRAHGAREIETKRTRHGRYYDIGEGQQLAILSLSPVHYETKDGTLELIDNALTADNPAKGFALRNSANAFQVHFPQEASQGSDLLFETASGAEIRLDMGTEIWYESPTGDREMLLQGKSQPGTAAGNTLSFPDRFPDTTETYTIATTGIKHNYDLRTPPSFLGDRSDGVLEFVQTIILPPQCGLFVDGNEMPGEFSTDGRIEIRDAQGDLIAFIPQAWAYDSPDTDNPEASQPDILTYRVSTTGARRAEIAVQVPVQWLTSPDRTYPITIDPSLIDSEYSAAPGTITDDCWQLSNGGSVYSSDNYAYIAYSGGVESVFYMRFPEADIPPGAKIQEVWLDYSVRMEPSGLANPLLKWQFELPREDGQDVKSCSEAPILFSDRRWATKFHVEADSTAYWVDEQRFHRALWNPASPIGLQGLEEVINDPYWTPGQHLGLKWAPHNASANFARYPYQKYLELPLDTDPELIVQFTPTTTRAYEYDKQGRVTEETLWAPTGAYKTSFEYDAAGRLYRITYPTGEVVTQTYNGRGLPWQCQADGGILAEADYNYLGQLRYVACRNGKGTTWTYWNTDTSGDNTSYGMLKSISTSGVLQMNYSWDELGNLTQREYVSPTLPTETYKYDDLSRLDTVTANSTVDPNYDYSEIGNITAVNTVPYTYHPDQIHAVTSFNGTSYGYDANGNMTQRGSQTITWDPENRPVTVSQGGSVIAAFRYDAFGDRVTKMAAGETTTYVNRYFEVLPDGTEVSYYYLGDLLIAFRKDGQLNYVYSDHLGSTMATTNSSGVKTGEARYSPFGNPISNTLDTDRLFTGQIYDAETGLYYYNARYYDAGIGRFISADTFVQNPANPQTLNRYSYVYNNPLKFTDPSGHFVDTLFDIGSALYDIYTIIKDPTDWENWAALGADVGCAFVPFVAGGGVVVRGVTKADDVYDMARGVDRASDAANGLRFDPNVNRYRDASGRFIEGPTKVVMGENMGRVRAYAKKIGAETIDDWLDGRTWTKELNKQWVREMKEAGNFMIDIGPDFQARLAGRLTPPRGMTIYNMERRAMKGYSRYQPVFRRQGKHFGGVSGWPADMGGFLP